MLPYVTAGVLRWVWCAALIGLSCVESPLNDVKERHSATVFGAIVSHYVSGFKQILSCHDGKPAFQCMLKLLTQ